MMQGHILILTFYWLFSFLPFFSRVPFQWKSTKLRFLSLSLKYYFCNFSRHFFVSDQEVKYESNGFEVAENGKLVAFV
jgi:hypothetical protein